MMSAWVVYGIHELPDHLGLLNEQTGRHKLKDGIEEIYDKIAADVRGQTHLSTAIDAGNRNDDATTLTLADGTTR